MFPQEAHPVGDQGKRRVHCVSVDTADPLNSHKGAYVYISVSEDLSYFITFYQS